MIEYVDAQKCYMTFVYIKEDQKSNVETDHREGIINVMSVISQQ